MKSSHSPPCQVKKKKENQVNFLIGQNRGPRGMKNSIIHYVHKLKFFFFPDKIL